MAQVYQVTSQHFSQQRGNNGLSMMINLPGYVLCMFKMFNCPECSKVEPIFAQLAGRNASCRYVITDVSQNRDIVTMSRGTSTPIESVPKFIFYVEGKPVANYKGARNIESLNNFVNKIVGEWRAAAPQYQQPGVVAQQPSYPIANPPNNRGGGGYTQPTKNQPKVHMPSFEGGKNQSYDDDYSETDEMVLECPGGVCPYNEPWKAYRNAHTLD